MTKASWLVTIGLTLCAASAGVIGADVLSDLGVSEGRAKEAFFDSFAAGTVSLVGNGQVFKAASPQARAAMVKTVTTLARTYTESDDFARRYADHREANAPDPLPKERTADDVLAKQRSDYEKQVTEMRSMFDDITPQQREVLERGFAEMRARFDEMEKDGTKAQLDAMLKVQRARDVAVYEEQMREYEREFPPEAGTLIGRRLRRFLAVCDDIEFSARLVERDKKMRFVDPALENRTAEWKMCFRAGQAATQTAREIAQDWLKVLEAKGVGQAP
jgi:hypothetical protein